MEIIEGHVFQCTEERVIRLVHINSQEQVLREIVGRTGLVSLAKENGLIVLSAKTKRLIRADIPNGQALTRALIRERSGNSDCNLVFKDVIDAGISLQGGLDLNGNSLYGGAATTDS